MNVLCNKIIILFLGIIIIFGCWTNINASNALNEKDFYIAQIDQCEFNIYIPYKPETIDISTKGVWSKIIMAKGKQGLPVLRLECIESAGIYELKSLDHNTMVGIMENQAKSMQLQDLHFIVKDKNNYFEGAFIGHIYKNDKHFVQESHYYFTKEYILSFMVLDLKRAHPRIELGMVFKSIADGLNKGIKNEESINE